MGKVRCKAERKGQATQVTETMLIVLYLCLKNNGEPPERLKQESDAIRFEICKMSLAAERSKTAGRGEGQG